MTGIVEKAPDAGKRRPSTLICPAPGVPNSTVPLWLAVIGNWSDSTKALWPFPANVKIPKPILKTGVISDHNRNVDGSAHSISNRHSRYKAIGVIERQDIGSSIPRRDRDNRFLIPGAI